MPEPARSAPELSAKLGVRPRGNAIRKPWLVYLFAVAATLGTLLVHRTVQSMGAHEPAPIIFLVPIIFSAYLGGLGPGLVATAIAALFVDLFSLEPTGGLRIARTIDQVRLASLVVAGILISVMSERLLRSRRRVEASERLQAVTLSSIGDAVVTTRVDGRVTFLNAEAERLTGWSATDAVGQPLGAVCRIVDPQTRQPLSELAGNTLHQGVAARWSALTLASKDGREIPVGLTCCPIRPTDGAVEGVVLVLQDSTERQRADQTLRESEKRYRLLAENVSDVIWVFDVDSFRFRFISPSVEHLRGYTAEEAMEQGLDSLAPDGYAHFARALPERVACFRRGEARSYVDEVQLHRKDGSYVWAETLSRFVVNAETGHVEVYGTSRDITERRAAEAALNESTQRYRSLFENMLSGYAYCEMLYEQGVPRDYVYVDVNPAFESLTGLKDVVGRKASEVIPGIHEANAKEFEIFARVATTAIPERFENWIEALEIWFSVVVYSPQKGHFVAVFDNITERREADEKLRESEARLRLAVEAAGIGTWDVDPATGAIHCSERYREIMGLPLEARVDNDRLIALIHPEDRERTLATIRQAFDPAGSGRFDTEEYRICRADGAERWVVSRGKVRFASVDGQGRISGVIGTVLDVTLRRQMERALRDSEARFRTLVEQASDAFFVHDLDGRFTDVNRRACESLGYTRAELLGMGIGDIEPAFDLEVAREIWAGIRPGEAVTVFVRSLRKDGTTFPAEIRAGACEIQGQRLMLALVRDITERQRAEEALRRSEALYRAVAANLPDGAVRMVDPELRFLVVEGPLQARLGPSRDQLEGRLASEALDEATFRMIEPRFRRALAGEACSYEFEYRGRMLWSQYVPLRDPDGRVVAAIGLSLDITGRKEAEDQIRRLNATLERRVVERTAQLEASNKELESFSYSVSHDLRAPLRAIDGFTRILAQSHGDALDMAGKGYLNRVLAATERMGHLIDDLLNLSRISRMDFVHQPVDLSALAHAVADGLVRNHPERQAEFVITEHLTVHGDPRLLRILLENLFDNAFKFTSQKAASHIELGFSRDAEGRRVCFVRDNGAGFDMRYADKLFGAFQRLHTLQEFPGTGIGLATVLRIVNRHGGKIWAEAQVGEGATFFFWLPE